MGGVKVDCLKVPPGSLLVVNIVKEKMTETVYSS